jgi:hypothetical protein
MKALKLGICQVRLCSFLDFYGKGIPSSDCGFVRDDNSVWCTSHGAYLPTSILILLIGLLRDCDIN